MFVITKLGNFIARGYQQSTLLQKLTGELFTGGAVMLLGSLKKRVSELLMRFGLYRGGL